MALTLIGVVLLLLRSLQERHHTEWGDKKVKLLYGDMRTLDVPEKVDVLVSELLGSFGDNELSPECLDGGMRFLKRKLSFGLGSWRGWRLIVPDLADGISIPSSYTAYIAPISSSKLYNETRAGKDPKSSETPYVVMLHAINILSDSGTGISGTCGPRIQECWEFEHPRKDAALTEQGIVALLLRLLPDPRFVFPLSLSSRLNPVCRLVPRMHRSAADEQP